MAERADAHAHFFKPGYVNGLGSSARQMVPDEITIYEALAKRHSISRVLAIGYEGEAAYRGNNAYLAELTRDRPWMAPLAYVDADALTVETLEVLLGRGFAGISLYLLAPAAADHLSRVSKDAWNWLVQHEWLVSVNSTDAFWPAWDPVLAEHPQLRVLVSHLGLPNLSPRGREMPEPHSPTLLLARHPAVYVKLSAFYASTQPKHDFPHQSLWPLIERLLDAFGADRLIWGSDFSPCLDFVSFPQTLEILSKLQFLSEHERLKIEGANLLRLLG